MTLVNLPLPIQARRFGQASLNLRALLRRFLRVYLSYTPLRIGRHPFMAALHPFVKDTTVDEVYIRNRGYMTLNLRDEAQYPLYYNIYEWKDESVLPSLLRDTRTVLDIGANIGQYTLYFALHARRVCAFEPVPHIHAHLTRHILRNGHADKVKLSYSAASDEVSSRTFALAPSEANSGIGSMVLNSDELTSTIEVQAEPIDRYLERERIEDVDLVKIDIEGGELMALRGMKVLLGRPDAPILLLEMNAKMMAIAGYSSSDLIEFLRNFGYSCYGIGYRRLQSLESVTPLCENYCFLRPDHLRRPAIAQIIFEKV